MNWIINPNCDLFSTSLLDVINALQSANSMSNSANLWSSVFSDPAGLVNVSSVQLMLVLIYLQYKQASQLFLLDA